MSASPLRPGGPLLLCLLCALAAAAAAPAGERGEWQQQRQQHRPKPPPGADNLPHPTSAGYVDVDANHGSSIYYQYYEADSVHPRDTTPIVLWLQGGPGCSSLFGTFYLNGPFALSVDGVLRTNPGRWNRRYGMLFIDQPIGTGFSRAGSQAIPREELTLAAHLYTALQGFYRAHPAFAARPLYITGESYAGKYAPSIAHYIIQAAAQAAGTAGKLHRRRALPDDVEPPAFRLGGVAIGNGFTDAVAQTLVQAEVAFNMGLLDSRQRAEAEAMQTEVVELVRNRNWVKARRASDALLGYITNSSATATLEDIRRDKAYDAEDRVSAYLNRAEVKANVGAPADIVYAACSKEVDAAMGHDVMKSVAGLVPDILASSHLMLYQGQFDAECGVASNEAWISRLSWPGHTGFWNAERTFWRDPEFGDRVLGFVKSHARLSHVVIRNAGHMVPHDRPVVSQRMIEAFVESVEAGSEVFDPAAARRGAPARSAPSGARIAAA
ncbi:SCPL50 [Scenedesmus sp. PABB004]|nr:SCPL50 [Scenedesmus sp. PABB004]